MNEKKPTPNNIIKIVTIFSTFVIGVRSPYPTVDRVTMLK